MIYLASDHRGFELKEHIKGWLDDLGLEYEDCGPFELDLDDDYPDFVSVAADKVAEDPIGNRGIILGGSGQGEAVVANRRRGVRAIVYYGGSVDVVKLGRLHDGANVLSLGVAMGNTIDATTPMNDDVARAAVEMFLDTEFVPEERHVRRIEKIDR